MMKGRPIPTAEQLEMASARAKPSICASELKAWCEMRSAFLTSSVLRLSSFASRELSVFEYEE